MNRLTIKAHLLRLTGGSRTLKLAEAHNLRQMITTNQAIDGSRSCLNVELVPLGSQSLHDKVLSIVRAKGIDLDHYNLKKKNRGYGVELLFTVTDGFNCDFYSLYSDCVKWLESYHPESVIAHAVVHFDEKTPHLHVVLVPIVNGMLQADKIRGYKEINGERAISLYEYLDPTYGLGFPVFLKGAAKKTGADKAIITYRRLPAENIRGILDQAIIQAIHSRPEPFMMAMKIPLKDAFTNNLKQL